MNITVHGYTATGAIDATIDGQRMSVPDDMANRHRQMIAEWEAAGNTIPAYVAPPAAPPDLLPYQFRAMLALSGKQAALDAYIAALPDPQKTIAQAKLDYSLTFRRDNDLVLAAQQALGLTDAQLDALWTSAAAIT
jgi:hypothetical protein